MNIVIKKNIDNNLRLKTENLPPLSKISVGNSWEGSAGFDQRAFETTADRKSRSWAWRRQ